jgi:hypothetical protein
MSSQLPAPAGSNTFERIKRVSAEGHESWSSRDFARVLGYTDYRNFEAVIEKARTACFNSGHRIEDHFVEITEMIEIGKGGQRSVKTVMLSRYAGYLVIQNADPTKALVALGQTYFAVQTRRQELADAEALQENQKRLLSRAEMKTRNKKLAGVAKQSGVVQPLDYAIFMDHGYRGLYGGLGMRDIHERKRLKRRNTSSTTWAAWNWRRIFSARRRPRTSCGAKMCRTRSRPTGFTVKWGAKSARPFTNWAARCRRICPWPRASRKSRTGRRNGSRPGNPAAWKCNSR